MTEPDDRRETPAGPGTLARPGRLRKAVARQMAASKREVPHFYVSSEIEMDQAITRLEAARAEAQDGARITMSAVLVWAAAAVLREHPALNAVATDEGFVVVDALNIGVAIAVPDGLLAPAILNCQGLDLASVASRLEDLVARTRAGRLKAEEMTRPTFTVSNLGMWPVTAFTAVVPPPQVAILAVGRTVDRAVVRDGRIVVAPVLTATLSADHRAVDGADAARFLTGLKELLEQPTLGRDPRR